MNPKFFIQTFGCQMNFHDSEKMAGILVAEGYQLAPSPAEAELLILNTCSVRAHAEEKVYSQLGRWKNLKKNNPQLILGLTGCVAKDKGSSLLKRMPYLNFILAPAALSCLEKVVRECQKNSRKQISVLNGVKDAFLSETLPLRQNKIKAFVSIMKGCDNFCTYCIVPYVRGREVSRPSQEILKEIQHLLTQGVIEITLLGQNVNSYGQGLKEKIDFAELLAKCNRLPGIRRIRFVTSHPKDLSLKLIETMAEGENICEHLHLPLQSGSDKILRLMNRRHRLKDYLQLVEKLRKYIPQVSLTTDLMVGFPGEEEVDFQATLTAVREIQFDAAFTFKYSPRNKTKASQWPDQVPPEEKQRRLEELIALQKEISLKKNKALIGQKVEVLFDGISKKSAEELTSRTRTNKIVIVKAPKNLIGSLGEVEIKKASPVSLIGERIAR